VPLALDEAADTLGAIGGPLLALVLVAFFSHSFATLDAYRLVFWLGAIPGLLAAVCMMLLVTESVRQRDEPLSFRRSLSRLTAVGATTDIGPWLRQA